ncbi:phenylalanine--tRNA ligase alpha subunit-like [Dendronephthya gigantea]|uniref:phenylalanine--tRNA ligase alpha subunit-like n=1 Tax=Dendronephthya gigantea TaxID=151771 RepID=UPI00106B8071|nr:phenylalanine--tRNA ligase alpha subunit-like [Dendronephthya gigantea]
MSSEALDKKILSVLDTKSSVDTLELANEWKLDHQAVVGAVKSLQVLDEVVQVEQKESKSFKLSAEGEGVAKNGSHEAVVFAHVPKDEGIPQKELISLFPSAKVGFNKAMAKGWLSMDKKADGGPRVMRKVVEITDDVKCDLNKIKDGHLEDISDALLKDYQKRKLVETILIKKYLVKKGANFSTTASKLAADLTTDLLTSNEWKTVKFKEYNFDAQGIPPSGGYMHPLMKVRAQFRQIFLEMGFTEMPTNNFIESSFWNFDSLFQPQQHPARDAHDTFFIANPKYAKLEDIPPKYIEAVKAVHQHGGYGSQGYQYDWKLEEAKKNILRTHTTAVSSRMLYKLAKTKNIPARYFSIDRVFRNETLDATHLAEFHQIEGLVADYNLTLGDLIGVLHAFFKKLGMHKLRFKPAYNPYTEPSMEIFGYHEGLGKWVEVGNSGVFRPEMLLPMGLPENLSVIAWGLSLERPTMIKYGLSNIRDLFGHKVDLEMVKRNPICRLDS